MDIFSAAILGAIQGLTEFLPVSSTGHLILAAKALGLPETDFQKSFEIIIQLGSILAVVVLYWRTLLVSFETQKKIAVAFLPTAIIGLAMYRIVKTYFLGNGLIVVAALFAGGVLILLFEKWYEKKPKEGFADGVSKLTYRQAFLVGAYQSVAVIPGVSRSGATILGGLSLGIKRETIVEFSFLLAVPTMAAATGLDLAKNYDSFSSGDFLFLFAGFVSAFITALFVIKLFVGFVKKHSFSSFGWYRIFAAIAFWFLIL